jgi:uncharacterized protein
MPTISREFDLAGSFEKVWQLMNDPRTLGACIPGCEEVTITSDTDSNWKLKLTVGIITRKVDAIAKVIERDEAGKLAIKLDSKDGDISGMFHVTLFKKDEVTTRTNFSADIQARGPFQWIVNQVINSQMEKFVDQFSRCISLKAK